MGAPPDIAPATTDDANELAALAAQTFAETFVGMQHYTQAIIDRYTRQAFALDVVRSELLDPTHHYFVLRVGGRPAGYAKLSERAPPACVAEPRVVNLHRLYLAREFHHRGLGTGLLARVFDEARRLGYPAMWLSVWEYHEQAVAFYRRHGFLRVGECEWAFESDGERYADTDWVLTAKVPDR